jgi:hypothetical protein
MRKIFFNSDSRGLRAGWRLLIFAGMVVGLGFLAGWIIPKIFHPQERPFLDPVGMIVDELQTLIEVLIATWIMARIERRRFSDYGIPVRNAFGVDFRVGLAWGAASTSLLVGLIAACGGYRIVGLAIHGGAIWYFLGVWMIANLLIGFSEEVQFRGYLLATLADGIGFWPASHFAFYRFWCAALFSEATRALGRLRLHWSAGPVRVPHAAPHGLAGFRHRLPRCL